MRTHPHTWKPIEGTFTVFHYRTNWYRRIVMVCNQPYHVPKQDFPMQDHFWKQIGTHWEYVNVNDKILLTELRNISVNLPPDKTEEIK